MTRILPLCAVLCLSACAVQQQPLPSHPVTPTPAPVVQPSADEARDFPIVELPYTRFTLDNGLRVIVHEDHKTPVVAVNVWYHVGSRDEPEGRHGFAHLFEHLMFNGSQHYDDEYFRALEPAGATGENGTTNTDRTNYYETVPTSSLDRALWLESDRMGYLTGAITQAKLDEQRGVVENEKRQDENQPYGAVDEILARESYPIGHPYSWTTIGSEADLNAAKLDDVKAWFKRYYGPNNAVLVIAGDIDVATAKAKAEHFFGALPPGPPVPHVQAWPAPMSGDKRLTITDRVPLPRVYRVWNVPGDGDHDTVMLNLLADTLGSHNAGRLYERLVYRDQIAASVSVGVEANEIGGQLQIVATAKPGGDPARIEAAIDEEVTRLLRDGPTAEELARIKTGNYVGFASGLESVGGGESSMLAENELFHDDPGHYKIELAWERAATPADIQAAGKRWLTQGSLTLEVLPLPQLKAAAVDADRKALPALDPPPSLKLPPVQHAVLSNGLKLVFAERHSAPMVEMQMIFDAGRAADDGGKSGTAAMTLGMLDEGAGALDSLAIKHRQTEIGAQLGEATTRDSSVLGLSAFKPRLNEALDLYASVLLDPKFPEADLARIKQQQLAAIRQEQAQPFGAARRVLSRRLYGAGHPYAFAGSGIARELSSISRDDLLAFYGRWFRPDQATLVVVGDTSLAEIQPLLEARFAGWKAPATPPPVKNVATVALPETSRVLLIDKPDSTQSLVMAANLAPPANDPQIEAANLVDTALGGMFISRLNLNLREDKHWSYGAGSALSPARGQQIFQAYANVERDHTADAMREMRKELIAIASGSKPLSPVEIDAAKRADTLSLPGGFETTASIAGGLDHIVEFQLADSYWNDRVPAIEAVSPPQLAAAAPLLIKPQALTWVIVGDLAKIEASVRKLGFGEVEVLNSDGEKLR